MADGGGHAQYDARPSVHRVIHAAMCRRAVVLASAGLAGGLDSARHPGGWCGTRRSWRGGLVAEAGGRVVTAALAVVPGPGDTVTFVRQERGPYVRGVVAAAGRQGRVR